MKDAVKVTFNGKEFEVGKIKIRSIGALAQTLNGLPEVFKDLMGNGEVQELDTQRMLELAPSLIMQAGETLPPFLSVASGMELEEVLDGGLDDLIILIQAVLEVNNFETIVDYLKNFKMSQSK
jgi:hypothetical protein